MALRSWRSLRTPPSTTGVTYSVHRLLANSIVVENTLLIDSLSLSSDFSCCFLKLTSRTVLVLTSLSLN